MKRAFDNMKWWQILILVILTMTVAGLAVSGVFMKISNASLRSENNKLVRDKINELDAKERYWRLIDEAYQDTMQMYHAERVLSRSRSDSIRDARKEIQKLKSKQYEIVRNFNDTTRGAELDRISAKHGL